LRGRQKNERQSCRRRVEEEIRKREEDREERR
jgi:hypothetical protein